MFGALDADRSVPAPAVMWNVARGESGSSAWDIHQMESGADNHRTSCPKTCDSRS